MIFLEAAGISFVAFFLIVPALLGVTRLFGFYTIVLEGRCKVYMLFGKVITVINEPGNHFLIWVVHPIGFMLQLFFCCFIHYINSIYL